MYKWLLEKTAKFANSRLEKMKPTYKFSGFRVGLYREGQLVVTQTGDPTETIMFTSAFGPIIMDGVKVQGYTLIPHLIQPDAFNVDEMLIEKKDDH